MKQESSRISNSGMRPARHRSARCSSRSSRSGAPHSAVSWHLSPSYRITRWSEKSCSARRTCSTAISLATILPGPVAVNVVAYVGYRVRGLRGALVSVIGSDPSCVPASSGLELRLLPVRTDTGGRQVLSRIHTGCGRHHSRCRMEHGRQGDPRRQRSTHRPDRRRTAARCRGVLDQRCDHRGKRPGRMAALSGKSIGACGAGGSDCPHSPA